MPLGYRPGKVKRLGVLFTPPSKPGDLPEKKRPTFCGERKECDSSSLQLEALNQFQSCRKSVAIIARKTDTMKIVVLNFDPRRARHRVGPVLTFIITAACQTMLFAGTTGSISGTIKDASGGVIIGVSLSATNPATGIQNKTVTDTKGFYSFPSLPVGRYDLKAEVQGFRVQDRKGDRKSVV